MPVYWLFLIITLVSGILVTLWRREKLIRSENKVRVEAKKKREERKNDRKKEINKQNELNIENSSNNIRSLSNFNGNIKIKMKKNNYFNYINKEQIEKECEEVINKYDYNQLKQQIYDGKIDFSNVINYLPLAIITSNEDAVRILLDAGANPNGDISHNPYINNYKNKNKNNNNKEENNNSQFESSMHIAQSAEIIFELILGGGNPTLRNSQKRSPNKILHSYSLITRFSIDPQIWEEIKNNYEKIFGEIKNNIRFHNFDRRNFIKEKQENILLKNLDRKGTLEHYIYKHFVKYEDKHSHSSFPVFNLEEFKRGKWTDDYFLNAKYVLEYSHSLCKEKPRRLMFLGILNSNINQVKRAINKGFLPNQFHICYSIRKGNIDIVFLLLPRFVIQFNHNLKNFNYYNENTFYKINNKLINNDDNEEKEKAKIMKYWWRNIIIMDDFEYIELLSEKIELTNPNQIVDLNTRALSFSIQNQYWNSVLFLLKKGAICTLLDAINALVYSRDYHNHFDSIVYLLDTFLNQNNFQNNYNNIDLVCEITGNNLLQTAVMEDNWEIVDWLIRKNADINSVNIFGQTALQIAVERDSPKIVEILLENGADVTIRSNQNNNSLFHIASLHPSSNGTLILSFLLRSLFHKQNLNIDINNINNNNIIKEILNRGGENGSTPLHLVAQSGNYESAKLLSQNNLMDLSKRDDFGLLPLDWAKHYQHIPIADLFFEKYPIDTTNKVPSNFKENNQFPLLSLSQFNLFIKQLENQKYYSHQNTPHLQGIFLFQLMESMLKSATINLGIFSKKFQTLGATVKLLAKYLPNDLVSELNDIVNLRNTVTHNYGVLILPERVIHFHHVATSLLHFLSGNSSYFSNNYQNPTNYNQYYVNYNNIPQNYPN